RGGRGVGVEAEGPDAEGDVEILALELLRYPACRVDHLEAVADLVAGPLEREYQRDAAGRGAGRAGHARIVPEPCLERRGALADQPVGPLDGAVHLQRAVVVGGYLGEEPLERLVREIDPSGRRLRGGEVVQRVQHPEVAPALRLGVESVPDLDNGVD